MIELLVVTAIIVLISSVILANNNRFGGMVLLENLAYNIALSIRQAQVYGISTARFQSSSNFTAGYGMHFALSSPDTYVLYADAIQPNGMYDTCAAGTPPEQCELIQTTSISNGYGIQSLCITPGNGTETCNVNTLDILFKRPEPDAWISASGLSCTLDNANCAQSARIKLVSPRGDTMSVTVEANGQISVGGATAAP